MKKRYNLFLLAAVWVVSARASGLDASIGIPKGCYFTPEADCFVPVGVPVKFYGSSEGYPDGWSWTFEGAEPSVSNEQNPEVVYRNEGNYVVMLTVSDGDGFDRCVLEEGVQVGGIHSVWNIRNSERGNLASVPLDMSWYGYYAGSNLYGDAFAEKFSAPVVKAEISGVDVYFASTAHVTDDAVIEVSVCLPDRAGLPSEKLASASLPVSALRPYGSGAPTVFEFYEPVSVDGEYFVVISGLPFSMRGTKGDEIAVLCSPDRGKGGESTVYSYVDYDGETYWRKDSDRHLSMAVAPVLAFTETGDEGQGLVETAEGDSAGLSVCFDGVRFGGGYSSAVIYDLCGKAVKRLDSPVGYVAFDGLESGVYIVAAESAGKVETVKFIKR